MAVAPWPWPPLVLAAFEAGLAVGELQAAASAQDSSSDSNNILKRDQVEL